jgi:hypothetical protein
MKRPIIAMVGHGTDGSEGIERGIHVRWAFRREVGFPQGGFCLYRRLAQKPPAACFDFDHVGRGKHNDISVYAESFVLSISSAAPISVEQQPLLWTERDISVYQELGFEPMQRSEGLVLAASAPIRLVVSPTPIVLLVLIAKKSSQIVAKAFGQELFVNTQQTKGTGGVVNLLFRGERIEAIEIDGTDLRIVQVCISREEPCESKKGWEPVAPCPFCLPVKRNAYGCGDKRPGCDEEIAQSRLSKDPCARSKYGGENLRDLLGAVRTLVDPGHGHTMGSRMLDYPVSFDDCQSPETDVPSLGIAALDLLLIASIDPNIARILGLYYTDTTAVKGQAYDYKIVGSWPEGTLWTLENSIDFEERQPGQVLLPGFVHAGTTFVADGSFSVVSVPSNFAGTKNAIQLHPDRFDWSPIFPTDADGPRRLFISFNEPVGEIQVYARQGGAGLHLNAYRNYQQVATANTDNPDALLVVHAPEIDMLELIGDIEWLYKLDYGSDYIPHGSHCHIVYGLTAATPVPLAVPGSVASIALPGVTRKKSDCKPLLEGALADTRYPIGVRWNAPTAPDGMLLSKDPILFNVERQNPDATTTLLTEDQPLMVTPPAPELPDPPSGWPNERQHFVDTVPYPGAYHYRVAGIDIFGRSSQFSDWSASTQVKPLPPPPPASVTAKWLDLADPFLAESERKWVEVDGRAGVLITWEWLETQERQSPYVEEFHILFENGWLNTLLGKVKTEPVEDADSFSFQVAFARQVDANTLAGMMMSHRGVPYRIRSNHASDAHPPFISTLVCGAPNSGTPKSFADQIVSIPLLCSVRAKVQSIHNGPNGTMDIQIFTQDLRVEPPGGIVGGVVVAMGQRMDIVSAMGLNVVASGVWVKVRVIIGKRPPKIGMLLALTGRTVNLELPSPNSTKDYRLTSSWPTQLGPVPAEGTGLYQVFVRTITDGEEPGRTTVDSRQHRLVTDAEFLHEGDIAYGQAAMAASALGQTGPVSSAATYVRVSRERPEPPDTLIPADDLTPVYASYPDYYGKASYAYHWPRTANMRYVVYRAIDETLFDVDRRVRSRRPQARANWDYVLDQFPDPDGTLRDLAFEAFVAQENAPDYRRLSNRLLQILASFPDVEEAFTKLHPEPISWEDPEYADRSLPGQGSNWYFYRVKAIDLQGNAAPLSASTPPIHLPIIPPPRAPVITSIVGGDRQITLAWVSSQEDLIEYRIYRAPSAEAAGDLHQMQKVATVPVDQTPSARPPIAQWKDEPVPGLKDFWYRIVAVKQLDRPDASGSSKWVSSPSPAIQGRAQQPPPKAPIVNPPTWDNGHNKVTVIWQMDDPFLMPCLERRVGEGDPWVRAIDWLPPGTLMTQDTPPNSAVSYEYRVRVRDHIGQQAIGDSVATP